MSMSVGTAKKIAFPAQNGITTDDWMLGRNGLGDKDRRAFDKQFQRNRYFMGDLVILPNHLHCLAVSPNATLMR